MKGEKKRKSGIDFIGDIPWGSHLCQFYQNKEDLIDILAPYFRAGLENNEFCMWVISEPLKVEDAKEAMRKTALDFDQYLKKGQIEIIPHSKWYLKDGAFNLQRVLNAWIEKLNQALAKGYDGLRVTGNAAWLEKRDWKNFDQYEEEVNKAINDYKMLAICTYCLDKCGAAEVIDVFKNHHFALIRQEGKWECIESESSERKKAEEEKLKAQQLILAEQVMAMAEEEKRIMAEEMTKQLKKQVEEKTQEIKEEHQLRERFIADASHELRTPLSILQTNLDLLSSLEDSRNSFFYNDNDIKDSIEISKNQIKNLTTIIEELSLLSRGKKPDELREKIKLESIIKEVAEELRALAEAKDINYEIKILDQDMGVIGDGGMLKKLVRNLISNAVKYGRKKGKVEITLRKQKRAAELQVADDGIGISKKDLPYIFERFYRTNKRRYKEKGGIGLGLAICKWIVELHKGKIEVESKYGKGSTFIVSLPLNKEA